MKNREVFFPTTPEHFQAIREATGIPMCNLVEPAPPRGDVVATEPAAASAAAPHTGEGGGGGEDDDGGDDDPPIAGAAPACGAKEAAPPPSHLNAALAYARRGIPVFPLHGAVPWGDGLVCTCKNGAQCGSPAKHPRTPAGFKDATTSEDGIRAWWSRWPEANIGIPTGAGTFDVLDVDPKHGGDAALKDVVERTGQLPPTALVRTGSGGHHVLFRHADGITNATGALPKGIDVRGDGGYVVAPPSLHVSGQRYEGNDCELAAWPPALLEIIRGGANGKGEDKPFLDRFHRTGGGKIAEGQQNEYLFKLGCKAVRDGYPESAIEAMVRRAYFNDLQSPKQGLDAEADVDKVMQSVRRYLKDGDRGTGSRGGSPGEQPLSPANDDPLPVLVKSRPYENAQEFARLRRPTLMRFRGDYLSYDGRAYAEVEPDTIKAEVYDFLASAQVRTTVDNKPKLEPFPTNSRTVNETVDALRAACHVEGLAQEPPLWLRSRGGPPAEEIVVCRNGLLHLATQQLHELTPDFFTRNALDIEHDPAAPRPERWLRFLDELWPDGQGEARLLQEWMGYTLVPDTSQQKILLIAGPPRSGKGTIGHVMRNLVGPRNVCAPQMRGIGERFGLEKMLGKTLGIVSDMRLGTKADQDAIAENLLRISGGDAVDVERKHRAGAWTGVLNVRFVILSNELPRLLDASGALANRFLPLETKRSFLGREDHDLAAKLREELPGILNWAVEGWQRLRERGRFELPASSQATIAQVARLASPTRAFLEERCECGPRFSVRCKDLHDAFKAWAVDNNELATIGAAAFGNHLRAAAPDVTEGREGKGDRARLYVGLRLREEGDNGAHF